MWDYHSSFRIKIYIIITTGQTPFPSMNQSQKEKEKHMQFIKVHVVYQCLFGDILLEDVRSIGSIIGINKS